MDDIVAEAKEDTTEAIIEEVKNTEEQRVASQSELQCKKCSLVVNTVNQLETYIRLQHTEVVNFCCETLNINQILRVN